MSREEKIQLNRDRQKAVRDAWTREKDLVCQGKGTRDWTAEQQKELIETGRVKGYEGQHMKSVNEYPEYAASADNIQFLTHEEHLEAHNSGLEKNGYHSPTNGYYDAKTREMHSFGDNPPLAPKEIKLSKPCYQLVDKVNNQSASRTVQAAENHSKSEQRVGMAKTRR